MNPPHEQLSAIVQGCRKKQRNSEKALYVLFFDYAMAVCARYAHNENDAAEIVQDGFLKVFKSIVHFQAPKARETLYPALKGWLKKIMIYTAIDHFRSQKKYPVSDPLDNHQYSLAGPTPHPLDSLMYEELIKLVQRLSPAYRTVFNLFVMDGFTHEEIAKMLQISAGTSKSNLAKAREKLRQMLRTTHKEIYARYE